jgi:hypothetical protein
MEGLENQVCEAKQPVEKVEEPKRLTPKLVVFKNGVAHVFTYIENGQVVIQSQFVEGKVIKVNEDHSPEKLAEIISR